MIVWLLSNYCRYVLWVEQILLKLPYKIYKYEIEYTIWWNRWEKTHFWIIQPVALCSIYLWHSANIPMGQSLLHIHNSNPTRYRNSAMTFQTKNPIYIVMNIPQSPHVHTPRTKTVHNAQSNRSRLASSPQNSRNRHTKKSIHVQCKCHPKAADCSGRHWRRLQQQYTHSKGAAWNSGHPERGRTSSDDEYRWCWLPRWRRQQQRRHPATSSSSAAAAFIGAIVTPDQSIEQCGVLRQRRWCLCSWSASANRPRSRWCQH